ncbi:unnamed protein product [Mycena citricolor]|uniref:Uncharacterized protein n=1 Tax=Mycena citricolor TaxID=2018698 RepID=A0AAD2GWE6_9AGAR|nr:unnamed protein product [Mycena citricolor]CAK5276267.1 unnamed protein product [Mycena citricolor]
MSSKSSRGRWKTEPSSSERIVPHQDQIAPLEVVIAYCMCSRRFCSAIARQEMSSVVDSTDSGAGRR